VKICLGATMELGQSGERDDDDAAAAPAALDSNQLRVIDNRRANRETIRVAFLGFQSPQRFHGVFPRWKLLEKTKGNRKQGYFQ